MKKWLREAHNRVSGPWQKGLTVKLMVGHRGVVFRLPVWLMVGVLLVVGLGLRSWRAAESGREKQLLQRIAQLEAEKRRVQTFLARKEREKKQALALAQVRSEELWNELRARDRQMDQIWKVVGKAPQGATKQRRSLASSRSGMHPLAVKRRYLELYRAMHNDDAEIQKLRNAAVSYRQEKARQAEAAMWNTQPTLWPCDGYFTSPFGYRVHPVLGYARFHSGCDIAAPIGTPIRATAAGRVTCADWMQGYGLAVTIDHGNGVSTLYGHCSSVSVKAGQYVRKGQVVAAVGNTGMSTGPHCHYEVSVNGSKVDPAPYLHSRR